MSTILKALRRLEEDNPPASTEPGPDGAPAATKRSADPGPSESPVADDLRDRILAEEAAARVTPIAEEVTAAGNRKRLVFAAAAAAAVLLLSIGVGIAIFGGGDDREPEGTRVAAKAPVSLPVAAARQPTPPREPRPSARRPESPSARNVPSPRVAVAPPTAVKRAEPVSPSAPTSAGASGSASRSAPQPTPPAATDSRGRVAASAASLAAAGVVAGAAASDSGSGSGSSAAAAPLAAGASPPTPTAKQSRAVAPAAAPTAAPNQISKAAPSKSKTTPRATPKATPKTPPKAPASADKPMAVAAVTPTQATLEANRAKPPAPSSARPGDQRPGSNPSERAPAKVAAAPRPAELVSAAKPIPDRVASDSRKVETVGRRGLPDVTVLRTSWHPRPERRSAKIRLESSDETMTLREGDAVGGLVISEISPSAVLFKTGDVEIRRRVGEAGS